MGGTQHTIGNNNTRAYRILQLRARQRPASPAGGTNIFRGHDNGKESDRRLPRLRDTARWLMASRPAPWEHWALARQVEYDWLVSRFPSKEPMEKKESSGLAPNRRGARKQGERRAAVELAGMAFWGTRRTHKRAAQK